MLCLFGSTGVADRDDWNDVDVAFLVRIVMQLLPGCPFYDDMHLESFWCWL